MFDDLVLDMDNVYDTPANSDKSRDIYTYNIKRAKKPIKKNRSVQKSVLKKLAIFFLVIIIGFGSVGGVVIYKMFGMNFIGDEDAISPDDEDFVTDEYDLEYVNEKVYDELSPDDVNLHLVEPIGDDELVNILLVGQDRREGETRARSDAMIVCSINPKTGKTAVVSFLRDLYVTIPGYSDNRLNAAFAFGGFKLLRQTLLANFGITIDGCFEADFEEFRSLIDIIGGTDINLTEAEAEIVGDGAEAGLCHLTGKQTLTYARIRKIGTDFGRTERQRTVILACFDKLKEMSETELLSLVNTALPYLSTDMTVSEISALIAKLTPLIPKVKVDEYFIPANGTYNNAIIKGMAVLVPDLQKNSDLLKNEYFPFDD